MLSCQRDIASCECEQIDVYGAISLYDNILAWKPFSENMARELGNRKQINDPSEIKKIKNLLLNLKNTNEKYGEINIHVVLDLICKNGGKSTILLNSQMIQIDDNYFDKNLELFELLEEYIEDYFEKLNAVIK